MAAAGLEVVGLDASHDMLMIARNKLEVRRRRYGAVCSSSKAICDV